MFLGKVQLVLKYQEHLVEMHLLCVCVCVYMSVFYVDSSCTALAHLFLGLLVLLVWIFWIISGHCTLINCLKATFIAFLLLQWCFAVIAEGDWDVHFWVSGSKFMKSIPLTDQASEAERVPMANWRQPRRCCTTSVKEDYKIHLYRAFYLTSKSPVQ